MDGLSRMYSTKLGYNRRSQTSNNVDRWKSTDRKKLRQGESQKNEDHRGRKLEERRSVREKVRREMQVREKVRKSRNSGFPMSSGSGESKSRLAKAVSAEPAGQMSDEKLHAAAA